MAEELCPSCKKGKLVSVKKEENVETKEFSCGHRTFTVRIEERILVSDSVHAIVIPSPIRLLQEAINQKDWFKGLIMSITYFEHFGINKLKEHFRSKGINIDPDKIDRLSLEEIIMVLYSCEIVDQPTYTKMIEVKKKRDKLVHQKKEAPIFEIEEGEAENLIKKAIECLKNLGAT